MPQHCNAVSNLPRVLFFVFLISLLINILVSQSLGEVQGHKESHKPLNEKKAPTALHTGSPFAVSLESDTVIQAAPKSAKPAVATPIPPFAKRGIASQPSSPSSAFKTTVERALVNEPAAERPLQYLADQTPSPSAFTPKEPVVTPAQEAAAHCNSSHTTKTAAPALSLATKGVSGRDARTEPEVPLTEGEVAKVTPYFRKGDETSFTPTPEPAADVSRPKLPHPAGTIPPQAAVDEVLANPAEKRRSSGAAAPQSLEKETAPVAPEIQLPDAAISEHPISDGDKLFHETSRTSTATESREHLKRALCRQYYKFVLGVHSSYNLDTLDCEYRPEPGSYIAEEVKEIPVQKDAAQARLDRIEAIKRLQRDAEANPTDRIIVEWDTACLKQLPTLMPDYVSEDVDEEFPVFDAYELHDSSERIILKRGVYLRDRIGLKEKADPEVRQVLKGREYALGVIASSLRLQVSRKATASGAAAGSNAMPGGEAVLGAAEASYDAAGHPACGPDCKRALQGVMLDAEVPTIQAAHYSKLGVDVLHIKNLKRKKKEWNIVRASQIPALITRLARENPLPPSDTATFIVKDSPTAPLSAAESFAATSGSALRNKLVERAELVVNCILKVSDDQKREVGSFRAPTTPPVAEPSSSGDPEQPRQWHLHSFLGNYTLWADRAWPELAGKPGNPIADNMIIAVLDTGCFIHQDFIDGFDIENSRFWVNKEETDCENHIDDDGNGYVDDCFGWDFVGDQAYPFVDDLGHGTSVTSVLAARHGDALGGRGIIATGKIMCLRVGGREGIWLSDTIPALDYALRMGAKVSNHSYGGKGFDQAEFSAFRRASQADHLAVTAAGNSGCDIDKDESCLFTPGAFDLDGILNVGANDVAGFRASFSNYGKQGVDVYAPGKSIFVGTNKAPNNGGKTCKHCYEFIDGTSFAAPMVSGIAAALWTHFEITQPIGWVASTQKKSLKVKEAIMYSVTGSRGVAGAGRVNGVVNFYKALHYYDTIPPAYSPEFPDPPNGYQPQESSSLRSSFTGLFLLPVFLAVSLCAVSVF